jgi:hypothetical protein
MQLLIPKITKNTNIGRQNTAQKTKDLATPTLT